MSAWFYRGARAVSQAFRLVCRIHRSGIEHVPASGPCILAANHISHFDPQLIATQLSRPVDYIASAEFYAHPVAQAVLRGMNAFPIDRTRRDLSAVKESLKRLRQGRLVGIFVEGGIRHGDRSILGGTAPNEGSLALAQVAGAPIVPTVILGADQLYQKRAWLRRPRVFIRCGAPFLPDPKADRADLARELATRMQSLAAELRAAHAITDREMPHSAQERWAETA